jgi:hypothetical protein
MSCLGGISHNNGSFIIVTILSETVEEPFPRSGITEHQELRVYTFYNPLP